jgi:hypothetical protein
MDDVPSAWKDKKTLHAPVVSQASSYLEEVFLLP